MAANNAMEVEDAWYCKEGRYCQLVLGRIIASGDRHWVDEVEVGHDTEMLSIIAKNVHDFALAEGIPIAVLVISKSVSVIGKKERVIVITRVSDSLQDRINAADWMRQTLLTIRGKGTGKADVAQALGFDGSRIEQAIQTASAYAANALL